MNLTQVQEKAAGWFEWDGPDRRTVTTFSACLFALVIAEDETQELRDQVGALRQAIRLTLEENAHLADGEVCTLSRLKDALRET